MRHKPVSTEELFWSFVRNRRLGGLKFKRQVLVAGYIADFVCLEHQLIVELDGPPHDARKGYDAARDACLRREGFTVLRFTNDDLGASPSSVAATILHTIENLPLPLGGEGEHIA